MINSYKEHIIGIFSSLLMLLSVSGYAFHSSVEDALILKNKVKSTKAYALNYDEQIQRKVVLPVSRGFNQQDTGLCWAYGFFDALETLYLIKNPDGKLEISRGAMQYFNYEDRTDLTIDGVEDYLNPEGVGTYLPEGGTAETADYIARHYGLVPFDQYHDVLSPMILNDVYAVITSDVKTPSEKRMVRDSSLLQYFGEQAPRTIQFNGEQMDRFEFTKRILPEGRWVTYALSDDDNHSYIDWPNDDDARRNELTHYVSKQTLADKIISSLENKKPVLLGAFGHQTLIYGVDYDTQDKPITLYIKDHYGQDDEGYFYKAGFELVVNELLNITVLESAG